MTDTASFEDNADMTTLDDPDRPYGDVIDDYWPNDVEEPSNVTVTRDKWSSGIINGGISFHARNPTVLITMGNGAQLEYQLRLEGPPMVRYAGYWDCYVGNRSENIYELDYFDRLEEINGRLDAIQYFALNILLGVMDAKNQSRQQ